MNLSRRRITRAAAAAATAIAASIALGLVPPAAQAIPPDICFGTGCDNKDPEETGCTSGSWVARSVRAYGGTLQLVYGNGWDQGSRGRTCQTNWARFLLPGRDNTGFRVYVERKSSRELPAKVGQRYGGSSEGTGIIYSDQLFAPGTNTARACVERRVGGQDGDWQPECTDLG